MEAAPAFLHSLSWLVHNHPCRSWREAESISEPVEKAYDGTALTVKADLWTNLGFGAFLKRHCAWPCSPLRAQALASQRMPFSSWFFGSCQQRNPTSQLGSCQQRNPTSRLQQNQVAGATLSLTSKSSYVRCSVHHILAVNTHNVAPPDI